MALPVIIRGQDGTGGVVAEVSSRGQLITAPIDYSKSFVASAIVDDIAYNLVLPEPNKVFVVTDIILTGTKAIDVNVDATVVIYEAVDETSTESLNILWQGDVARSSSLPMIGLNVITENEATYINVKSSDTIVNTTLMGYFLGHHHVI